MDDIVSTRPGRSKTISAAEMERRRQALRQADAGNRIEGQFRSPESGPIFEAFIRGDIEMDDILPRLNALHLHR
jgi:Antitoxin VbhA